MSTLRVNSIGSQDKSGSSSNYRFQTHFIINNADVGGTRKNKLEVWLAVPILIKYINITNAPKEIAIICQDILKIKYKLKVM